MATSNLIGFHVGPVFVSANLKTGFSLNFNRLWCRMTRLCRCVCYGKKVTTEEARRLGIKPNRGPVTWPAAQERYDLNTYRLKLLPQADRIQLGQEIGARLLDRGYDNLRICGTGEIGPPVVDIIHGLMLVGVRPWGFSKRDDMLEEIARLRWRMGLHVEDPGAPCFMGSTDESMPRARVKRLITVTEKINDVPRLAYMTMNPGWVAQEEVNRLWFAEHLAVVFGYHTASHKTKVWHELVCPSTNDEGVHCQDCRRCLQPEQTC